MIVCAACGTTNGDGGQFCAACGEYLWEESTPAATGDRNRPGPAPSADPRTASVTPPAPAAGPGPLADGPATGADRQPTGADGTPTGADRQPTGADRQPTGADGPGSAGDSAGPGFDRPVAEGRASGTPVALQPGPPPVVPGPGKPLPGPVDNVDPTASRPPEPRPTCPHCGTENPPQRRICRSCGRLLAAPAPLEPERTWWQRWWERLRRREPRRASPRDRRAVGATRRILLIVLGICLVGVLAVAGPPLARRTVEAVRDHTQDPSPLVPAAVSASSERLGDRAARLTDGANNRYWAPNGTPVGAWVESRFAEPVRLLTVIITPGVGLRRQEFLKAGRPRGLTVVTVDTGRRQEKTDIELRDEPGPQEFTVEASNVVQIRLVVRSTYGSGLDPAVAIAEAEFFGRR